MRWRLGLVLGPALAACSGAGVAPDTDCATPDVVAEQVLQASIVLVGTATDWDGTSVEFEVEEVWRGPTVPGKIEIVPESGRVYATGTRYLAFPSSWPPPLADARCSATTRWDESLIQYRPAEVRSPAAAPLTDPDLPWEWVLLAVCLFGGLAAARRIVLRIRYHEPVWDPSFRLGNEEDPER